MFKDESLLYKAALASLAMISPVHIGLEGVPVAMTGGLAKEAANLESGCWRCLVDVVDGDALVDTTGETGELTEGTRLDKAAAACCPCPDMTRGTVTL